MRAYLLLLAALSLAPAACGSDGGPPADAATDAAAADAPAGDATDDAAECLLGDGGTCVPGTTCRLGRCPDGTPVSCGCSAEGRWLCTGACPPLPDGGVGCHGS